MTHSPQGTAAVAARIARVQDRVADACARRGPGPPVRVVAVIKRQPAARIAAAVAAGLRDLGENYAQELREHRAALEPAPPDLRWHFIGTLQSNKVRRVVGCELIHSVDRPSLLVALQRQAQRSDVVQRVLVQIRVGDEPNKAGIPPPQAAPLLRQFDQAPNLRCVGLMALPPRSPPREAAAQFAQVRRLMESLGAGELPNNVCLQELSMGTSDDFEIAIAQGATLVRLGTVLMGPRP